MEHYRYYRVIASKIGGERITDIVQFFPQDVPILGDSPQDRARQAAIELIDAITSHNHTSPIKHVLDKQVHALQQLAKKILGTTEHIPEEVIPLPPAPPPKKIIHTTRKVLPPVTATPTQ